MLTSSPHMSRSATTVSPRTFHYGPPGPAANLSPSKVTSPVNCRSSAKSATNSPVLKVSSGSVTIPSVMTPMATSAADAPVAPATVVSPRRVSGSPQNKMAESPQSTSILSRIQNLTESTLPSKPTEFSDSTTGAIAQPTSQPSPLNPQSRVGIPASPRTILQSPRFSQSGKSPLSRATTQSPNKRRGSPLISEVPEVSTAHDIAIDNEKHVNTDKQSAASKRARPSAAPVKELPQRYELCEVDEIVMLIAHMLSELIETNDSLALRGSGNLTRFHSRTAPGISVRDYLGRLAKHASLTPPLLLAMVYYIDRLCALYPDFTINTLTVHRFLITAATVAAKGLSDSFWNNSTYARVGGVRVNELKMLELEFLYRVDWRIVPEPDVLVAYYAGLVERCPGFVMQGDDEGPDEGEVEGDAESVISDDSLLTPESAGASSEVSG